ncbi:hypothetical protein LGH83_04615 [Lichenihabitans sp. PAMC28606]|uniref:hypothetical protein n=1 Tax=Lichenihabitans sp. PAMC28606 TaxID=2880932 RepID=UPI001D0B3DA4|nr:hypothetical protein [Lichenihabitans sp. PAMC28606]UDL95510.1 hypothetical protein LGH83_04615 [Lichenihabitans sp. PAMC28606]
MADDHLALAAITAQSLAVILQAAANRLPLTAPQGQSIKTTVFAVSAIYAPRIETIVDVATIGGILAGSAETIRTASAPKDVVQALYDAATASSTAAPTFTSPARTRSAALSRTLAECIEAAWLGEAFVAEAQTDFGDRQAAIAARKRIATAMDVALDRIAAATGRAVIDVLGSVARTASDHIATVSANLRPIVRVQTARSAPSTAIAFELYGDPSRATELVARNKVACPLFMPTVIDALAPAA